MAEKSAAIDSVAQYFALGRSGLRVSPLCLGTMTFGTEWGWGNDAETSRAILHRYLEAGGNFLDTADGYTNGHSEELLGQFLNEAKLRERVVLATKYTFNPRPGDPNGGGNARKNLVQALEGSLRRLRTDYVDLYWLHAWDTITPVEEVVRALDEQVRAGKIRYIGLSNTPAWYLARAQTLAELHGFERIIALQLEYSLIERAIEREHIPAALELGMGVCPWSPLASGFLSGKYRRGQESSAEGRLSVVTEPDHPLYNKLTDRNYRILETLLAVATELGKSPSQIALNWTTKRPGVSSTLIGATKLTQLDDNLRALEFDIPSELSSRLEAASRPEVCAPYMFYGPPIQGGITGGARIAREPPWFRGR